MSKVIIIGSGFSSLAAACYMQKAGYEVTVLEKNEQLGGRASQLKEEGFTFDMGPSWYWMPDVFEKFFNDFGKKASDYYTLEKLDPAYRVYFGVDDYIDIPADTDEIIQLFDNIDPGSGEKLKKFLKKAKANYGIAMKDLVYKPGISLKELVTVDTAKRVGLFLKDITKDIKKITKNDHLRQILSFPVLFLGAKPSDTPAFYNFMNWADFGLGTWYPKGGMKAVVNAMVDLGKSLGVEYQTNTEVVSFSTHGRIVTGVRTENQVISGDYFISGADYAHTEKMLEKNYRNFEVKSWNKRTFAPSSLLYYVGFSEEVKGVLHHNLFFDTDFDLHAEEIYKTFKFPTAPLFYANFPSKSDANLAPAGMESAFFLIPTAVDLEDNEEIQDRYFDLILDRLEKNTGQELKNKIVYRKNFGISDFKSRYYACRGNAYGMANTLFQTSVLRPGIRNKKLNNLFYTGQLTVPGPGVPPALISGKIVSDYIIKNS